MKALLAASLGVAVVALVFPACAEPPPPANLGPPSTLRSPFTGYESPHYKNPSAWLCLPGRADACADDLDATELLPDGSRALAQDRRLAGADDVDCFYVYPTVDMTLFPGNHTDFSSTESMARATVAQAARFRDTCRLFVPLYRQVTLGTYFRSPEAREPYLAVATSDVVDAFVHYMATYNGGRKVVLIGHSQGAEMVTRLLRRFFDDDPAMRDRLVLAMPIGGHLDVKEGSTVGGTFAHIPVCTRAGEMGCVVGYRSFAAGANVEPDAEAPAPGLVRVCVNPAELDNGPGKPFSRAFFPLRDDSRQRMRGVDGITTPFVVLRDFYSGSCHAGPGFVRYLSVSTTPPPGDVRVSPVDFSSIWLRGKLGLHILDFQLAQGDLVDLVAHRVAALRAGAPSMAPEAGRVVRSASTPSLRGPIPLTR
jgi:pimeloyl-ACP methyl ester carboxylesterase